jgi:hypothetical protein
VAHGHHQQRVVCPLRGKLDAGHQRQHCNAAMGADGPLGPPRGARGVHQAPGVVRVDGGIRFAVRGGGEQVSYGRHWPSTWPEPIRIKRSAGNVEIAANRFDGWRQRRFADECGGARIFDDVLRLHAGQTEIDRHGNEARLGRSDEDLRPLDAVVGQDGNPVAPGKAEAGQCVGELAGAPVPLAEGHLPGQVARTGPVWLQAGLGGEDLADVERFGGDHRGSVPALLGMLSASSRAARLA